MSQVNLKKIIGLLEEFAKEGKAKSEIILTGGLALQYYGKKERKTIDVDAQVKGEIEKLLVFLKERGVPGDLGENISNWSVVSLPSGYEERAVVIKKTKYLTLKVLSPQDMIIAKLRRFTEIDLEDALFLAGKFKIPSESIDKSAQAAIRNSPKDTAIFLFKKNLRIFLKELEGEQKGVKNDIL